MLTKFVGKPRPWNGASHLLSTKFLTLRKAAGSLAEVQIPWSLQYFDSVSFLFLTFRCLLGSKVIAFAVYERGDVDKKIVVNYKVNGSFQNCLSWWNRMFRTRKCSRAPFSDTVEDRGETVEF